MEPPWKTLLREIAAEKRVPAALRKRAEEILTPGIPGRKSTYTPEQVAEVARLRATGLTWPEVSEQSGIPLRTAKRMLTR